MWSRNVHKRPTCTAFWKEERREERVMWVESDKRPERGKRRRDGMWKQTRKKIMRKQDVGRNRKWGWPTGTRVICSVLTEYGFDFKILHGSGSQMQVRNQKETSNKAAINGSWFPGKNTNIWSNFFAFVVLVFSRWQHTCTDLLNHSHSCDIFTGFNVFQSLKWWTFPWFCSCEWSVSRPHTKLLRVI